MRVFYAAQYTRMTLIYLALAALAVIILLFYLSESMSPSPYDYSSRGELGVSAMLADRPPVGNRMVLPSLVAPDTSSVDILWYPLTEDERAVLAAAPPAEGTGNVDDCASGMANYSSSIIGRPSGNFAEPSDATGYSLFAPREVRRGCLRAGTSSIQESITAEVCARESYAVGPRAGRSNFITRGTGSSSTAAESMWGRPGPAELPSLARGDPGYPFGLSTCAAPPYEAEANTNMFTPDISLLPRVPEKCERRGADGTRILEDCWMYSAKNPFDDNM